MQGKNSYKARVVNFDSVKNPVANDNLDITRDLIEYRIGDFSPTLLAEYRKKCARRGYFETGNKAELATVEKWQASLQASLYEVGRILDAYRAGQAMQAPR